MQPTTEIGQARLARTGPGQPAAPGQGEPGRFELHPAATARFFEIAKTAGTSVHGLVCSALLVAPRTLIPPPDGPVRLTVTIPVDLRPYATPPLPTDRTVAATWVVNAAADVGRSIVEQVHAAISNGDVARLLMAAQTSPPDTHLIVTNLGRLAPARAGRTPAHQPSSAAVAVVPCPTFAVFTLDGRLTAELIYNGSACTTDQMREPTDSTRAVLEALTA